MSQRSRNLVLALILVAACLPLAAQTYTFQTFSIPNQNANPDNLSINNRGAVVGVYYSPTDDTYYGFKRDANGVFELGIDYPSPNIGTFATAINSSGDIYGFSYEFPLLKHGFVRKGGKNGVFTTIDVPPGPSTLIFGANNRGDFVGLITDRNGPDISFSSIAGVVTLFQPLGLGGQPNGIAADGSIVGFYYPQNGTAGFLMGPKGNSFGFEVENSIKGTTVATGINNEAGKIVGNYSDLQDNLHGFVYDYRADLAALDDRSQNTFLTVHVQTVDYPGAVSTWISDINSKGQIVGLASTIGHFFTFIGTPTP
jgi:hypothetical protein